MRFYFRVKKLEAYYMLGKNFLITASVLITAILLSSALIAGGWKTDKGLEKITLKGELVCIGCSLKKHLSINSTVIDLDNWGLAAKLNIL